MLAIIEFFEVYRVLWILEFVDTDLEYHHLKIKYFTSIYKKKKKNTSTTNLTNFKMIQHNITV